jgi:hypothetical protein
MTPNLHPKESSPKFVGCATQPFPDVPEELLNGNDGQHFGAKISPKWRCVASQKSLRTINPIRAIVDPIVANGIRSGEERGDGKEHISLAVRQNSHTDG